MTTMLEKMIAAVKADIGAQMSARPLLGDHISGDWHARGDLGVVDLDRCCRAALEVLREADDKMLNAAFKEMNLTPGKTWKAMKASRASEREIFHAKHKPRYTAMIDAILNEKTP
jgi:hypothetical protein